MIQPRQRVLLNVYGNDAFASLIFPERVPVRSRNYIVVSDNPVETKRTRKLGHR